MPDAAIIALVRPSWLGTYGDGGNALVLARRLRWRGIAAEILEVDGHDGVPLTSDFVVLGGGEDEAQTALARDARIRRSVTAAANAGAVVFGVCAGFQLLGTRFVTFDGECHDGLGLLDAVTERALPERAVGELLARSSLDGIGDLTGFENHGGSTSLGPGTPPLARVVVGTGNGDGSGTEGAVADRVVATYLHGPVLARNPALADHLLTLGTGPLPPLEVPEVEQLRAERIAAARRRTISGVSSWRRLRDRVARAR